MYGTKRNKTSKFIIIIALNNVSLCNIRIVHHVCHAYSPALLYHCCRSHCLNIHCYGEKLIRKNSRKVHMENLQQQQINKRRSQATTKIRQRATERKLISSFCLFHLLPYIPMPLAHNFFSLPLSLSHHVFGSCIFACHSFDYEITFNVLNTNALYDSKCMAKKNYE